MLRKETKVIIADNSGGLEGKIFHIYKKSPRSAANSGDIVRVAIKKAVPNSKVKKGDHYKAVIVSTNAPTKSEGKWSRAGYNAVVLLNNKNEPLGTKVHGNVSEQLVKRGYQKILSMSDGVF